MSIGTFVRLGTAIAQSAHAYFLLKKMDEVYKLDQEKKFYKAESVACDIIRMCPKHIPPNDWELVILVERGNKLAENESYEESYKCFKRAYAIASHPDTADDIACVLNEIANYIK